MARATIPSLPAESRATPQGWIADAVADLKSKPQIVVTHDDKLGTYAHMKPVEIVSDVDKVTFVKRLKDYATRYGQAYFSVMS